MPENNQGYNFRGLSEEQTRALVREELGRVFSDSWSIPDELKSWLGSHIYRQGIVPFTNVEGLNRRYVGAGIFGADSLTFAGGTSIIMSLTGIDYDFPGGMADTANNALDINHNGIYLFNCGAYINSTGSDGGLAFFFRKNGSVYTRGGYRAVFNTFQAPYSVSSTFMASAEPGDTWQFCYQANVGGFCTSERYFTCHLLSAVIND